MLKLRDVYAEFSAAAGFEPNLNELETVAGTESAVSIYDLRRLDLVYVSHLPAARLGQNVFTRVRSGYQTRSAGGQTYYARQSGDRMAAFAFVGEYVVASTREDLLTSALELIQGASNRTSIVQERWYGNAIGALSSGNSGAAELRLVVDLTTAIKTPYFRSYWVQKNTDDLRSYYAFVSQIARKSEAIEETRVLLRSDEAPIVSHEAATRDLLRYVPESAGLSRVWDAGSSTFALDLVRQKLFAGRATPGNRRYAPQLSVDESVGSIFDLQTRIDEPPKPSLAGALDLEPLKRLLDSAGIEAVLHLESSLPVDASTFVGSDAAIALRAPSPWNGDAVRSALTSAVASYQSVGDIGLQWRNVPVAGATVSQLDGLLPLVVYVDGQTLWVARSSSLVSAALTRAASNATPSRAGAYFARFNHRAELPAYLRLMRMLDLSEQTNYAGLFSDNIGSLGSSLNAIESVSVAVEESPLAQRQFVVYRLAQ